MVGELEDPRRTEPPYILGERDMLDQWLEFHRATLILKCAGLDDVARKARPVATSKLSLHGLVRHMGEVERNWFHRVLLREPETPPIWYDVNVEDSELVPLDKADWDADLAAFLAECEASRAASSGRDLDETGMRRGEAVSLRWIYVHMIEEYARHCGHADILREMIDGTTGY